MPRQAKWVLGPDFYSSLVAVLGAARLQWVGRLTIVDERYRSESRPRLPIVLGGRGGTGRRLQQCTDLTCCSLWLASAQTPRPPFPVPPARSCSAPSRPSGPAPPCPAPPSPWLLESSVVVDWHWSQLAHYIVLASHQENCLQGRCHRFQLHCTCHYTLAVFASDG